MTDITPQEFYNEITKPTETTYSIDKKELKMVVDKIRYCKTIGSTNCVKIGRGIDIGVIHWLREGGFIVTVESEFVSGDCELCPANNRWCKQNHTRPNVTKYFTYIRW